MDVSTATPLQLLAGATTALAGVIVVLWRQIATERKAFAEELREAREEADEWQEKWAAEVKDRSKDSELFMRALARRHSGNSDPPSAA